MSVGGGGGQIEESISKYKNKHREGILGKGKLDPKYLNYLNKCEHT